MKPEDMKTLAHALEWALRRISASGLGLGEYFEGAEKILREQRKSPPTQVFCYWPEGSREYLEFDHWPQRSELPDDAVSFELAVPDPSFNGCQIPPLGWRCTRTAGNEGPCATVECPEDLAFVAAGMQRLRDA